MTRAEVQARIDGKAAQAERERRQDQYFYHRRRYLPRAIHDTLRKLDALMVEAERLGVDC
jgi:hypothetical protein